VSVVDLCGYKRIHGALQLAQGKMKCSSLFIVLFLSLSPPLGFAYLVLFGALAFFAPLLDPVRKNEHLGFSSRVSQTVELR
jgi:hypothetical protein